MQNPFLVGDKIYLRPLEKEDARLCAVWFNDAEVTRTLLTYRPLSVPAEEGFLERISGDENSLALGIVVQETDQLIGVCGLKNIDWRSRHAEFGITIGAKQEWGKGYGAEATKLIVRHSFLTLNLNRVYLHTIATHERALRAYERAGFQREGLARQGLYRDGKYHDLVLMSILREEWRGEG
jgi:RimJ/RimL family protein N-acetyltransferase